ncbi:hypothetical protein NKDENANG_00509 [Candidatus Entotheonellaceae bacterium PAL068K]
MQLHAVFSGCIVLAAIEFIDCRVTRKRLKGHVTAYLAERLQDLQRLFVRPIPKRLALHEHDGVDGVVTDVRRLLGAIPDLELVTIPQLHDHGHQCSGFRNAPTAKDNVHRVVLEHAAAASVEILVDIYHSCHRDLVAFEPDYPFTVCNFISLIGEALGSTHQDLYKRMVIYHDLEVCWPNPLRIFRPTASILT